MKKRSAFLIVPLLLLAAGRLFGQGPELEDPQDLFPSVVLEIEDLSVERIEAGLPREAELMSFERDTPLPGPGEIRLVEPAVESLLPGADRAAGEKSFFTDVLFGAGLENNLLGAISFYRLGLPPLIRLLFSYENADGFGYRPVGLGYGERRDRFEGSLKHSDDLVSLEVEGGFREAERGLQERTAYYSASSQFSHLRFAFSGRLGDAVTIALFGRAAVTSFSVTGAAHPAYPVDYPPVEILAGGGIRGLFAWPSVRLGLGIDYAYRDIPGGGAFRLHRFMAAADARIELSDQLSGEGTFGVFTSTPVPYLLPFSLSFRGYPVDWLCLTLGGGYRVKERNLSDTLASFARADFPARLPDNHGWYGNAGVQFSFENAFLLSVTAALSENAALAALSPVPDASTGLFPVMYGDGVTEFELEGRITLPLASWFSVNALSRLRLPFAPGFPSGAALGGEALAEETTGAYGAKVSLVFTSGLDGAWEFPYLDASAYIRILDRMKLSIEALDLLQPLLGGPRLSPSPYVAPGIRARFKMQISL